jgi:hypothetical protein
MFGIFSFASIWLSVADICLKFGSIVFLCLPLALKCYVAFAVMFLERISERPTLFWLKCFKKGNLVELLFVFGIVFLELAFDFLTLSSFAYVCFWNCPFNLSPPIWSNIFYFIKRFIIYNFKKTIELINLFYKTDF